MQPTSKNKVLSCDVSLVPTLAFLRHAQAGLARFELVAHLVPWNALSVEDVVVDVAFHKVGRHRT